MRTVIFVACLVGIISGFFHFWLPAPLTLNTASPSFNVDETFFYAPKTAAPLNHPGELIPAGLMWLLTKLTGSTVNAFIAADFIFPALTFLALFLLTRSILVSISVLVFYHYLTYFPYLPSVIKLLVNYFQTGSYWPLVRGFHPQISLGLWFIFALRPNWLTLTLLTYTDFFYWTAALTWLIFKRYWRPLIFWLLAALPYWFYTARLFAAADFWKRNYYFVPPTINQLLLLVFGLILSFWQKRWRGFYLGSSAIILFAWLIRFGADDPIGHWFLRVVNPMTAILIFSLLFNYLNWPKIARLTAIALLLVFQFRLHWQYFYNNAAAFTVEPERLEAFNWLKRNTPADSVVAADMKNSLYLPAYTHNQPYLKQAQLSHAGNDELIQRFLEVYKISHADLVSLFTDDPDLIAKKRFDFDACAGHFLFFRLYQQADYYHCSVPDEILAKILNQFDQTPPQLSYPADYWLGTDPIDLGRLVWENQTYRIYALR